MKGKKMEKINFWTQNASNMASKIQKNPFKNKIKKKPPKRRDGPIPASPGIILLQVGGTA